MKDYYYSLFEFIDSNFDLILLDSQLSDIIELAKEDDELARYFLIELDYGISQYQLNELNSFLQKNY